MIPTPNFLYGDANEILSARDVEGLARVDLTMMFQLLIDDTKPHTMNSCADSFSEFIHESKALRALLADNGFYLVAHGTAEICASEDNEE